jgi:pimeloyl-ACP methyl ester carboxylesterase
MDITHPRQISVHGIALETLQIGGPAERPTLVFLHEGLGSVALWRDWPQKLCQRLGLPGLVYSRQGYGQSEPRPDVRGEPRRVNGIAHGRLQPDYMHHEARVVLPELLRQLGIAHPVLLGHSDGGTIALLHASQHPVAGCIVMAPHVIVEDISVKAIAEAREAYLNGPLRQRLAAFHSDVDCAFWQWNDAWLNPAFRSYDIRPELTTITAPLLAIQGEGDAYGTLAQIDEIALKVPHTRLVKLADCGHSPHRDQPEAVAQAIEQFIAAL